MKGWLPAILLICAVAVLAWFFASRIRSGSTPTPAVSIDSNSTAVMPGNSKSSVKTFAPSSQENPSTGPKPSVPSNATSAAVPAKPLPYQIGAAAGPPSDISPQTVIENTRRAIVNYGSTFGGNPVGTNPEITAALNGQNPKQIKFIDPEAGLRVNGNGELVDSWGTPFFFHQLSANDTEIRSAGPDKVMWTADDLVIK
jgi:hypothetical protein